MSLEKDTLEWLDGKGSVTVQQLLDALRTEKPKLTEEEITDLVWQLTQSSKVHLEDPVFKNRPMRKFLGLWEWLLWFYVTWIVAVATILAVYLIPADSQLIALRWLLGSLFMFFLPGYMAVEALYPKTAQLAWIERALFSIGFSITLVMFVGLLVNETPWGITATPIVITLTAVTIGLSVIALVRRYIAA